MMRPPAMTSAKYMGFHLTLATRPGGGSPGAPRATALRLVQSLAIMLTALALVAEKVGDPSLEGGGFHPSIALSAAWVTRWYVRLQPALLFQCADGPVVAGSGVFEFYAESVRGRRRGGVDRDSGKGLP